MAKQPFSMKWFLRGYSDYQLEKDNLFEHNHPDDFDGGAEEWRNAQEYYNQGCIAAAKEKS